MTKRTHDAAIRALRAEALKCVKASDAGRGGLIAGEFRLAAAAYTMAADALASIVGASERKPKPVRLAGSDRIVRGKKR